MFEPNQLSYAQAKPRLRSLLIRAIVVTTIALIALKYSLLLGRWCDKRSRVMKTQARFIAFSTPEATLVYAENEAAKAITLLPPYTEIPSYRSAAGSSILLEERGRFFRGGEELLGSINVGALPGTRIGTLYAGPLLTPKGVSRCVQVDLEQAQHLAFAETPMQMTAVATVIEPGGWFDRQVPSSGSQARITFGNWPLYRATREETQFFAGQADPNNASRFLINYRIGGKSGEIEGMLDDDLNVSLIPKTGPLSTPAE